MNEQAAREIYLKAFQAPVEKGNANGVMIAYTRWGCTWSGGSKPLVTGILREEWGCDGLIITDNVLTTYVNGVDGVHLTRCFHMLQSSSQTIKMMQSLSTQ